MSPLCSSSKTKVIFFTIGDAGNDIIRKLHRADIIGRKILSHDLCESYSLPMPRSTSVAYRHDKTKSPFAAYWNVCQITSSWTMNGDESVSFISCVGFWNLEILHAKIPLHVVSYISSCLLHMKFSSEEWQSSHNWNEKFETALHC